MDHGPLERLGGAEEDLETLVPVIGLDGKPLGPGTITKRTQKITMQVGLLHKEDILFFIFESPHDQLVLGHPWLMTHNPSLNWRNGELESWGTDCFRQCLVLPLRATSIESPKVDKDFKVLESYIMFADVFDNPSPMPLPPHREWDCKINLFPGASLPKI